MIENDLSIHLITDCISGPDTIILLLQWVSYQIRKIAGCACAGNAGNVSPRRRFQRKPIVCDPGMHHGTCVTHVPWCMSGSITRDGGENVPGIPGACASAILRIWQEAHATEVIKSQQNQAKNKLQYIPRNTHTVFALLCFVVVIHWLIFPYPSRSLHWHCGNLTIAPMPAKQPWWIWINTSCEFIMNDCITTTKQSTAKPCAYFLGYTVFV